MQNYIDALAAHADRLEKAAQDKCKEARRTAEAIVTRRESVIASILGVTDHEVSRQPQHAYPRATQVSRWPGVSINVNGAKAWKKQIAAEQKAKALVGECCADEVHARSLKGTTVANQFRAFLRARYGAKPKVSEKVAIAAFLDATKPVACKAP